MTLKIPGSTPGKRTTSRGGSSFSERQVESASAGHSLEGVEAISTLPTTSIPGSSAVEPRQEYGESPKAPNVAGSNPAPGAISPRSRPGGPLTAASKLYIVVLRALSTGLKIAQACHALRAFTDQHADIDADWYATSNNIVVLQADDLPTLADRMDALGLAVARFHEPDRDDELTALCVEPGAAYTLRRYPLAT